MNDKKETREKLKKVCTKYGFSYLLLQVETMDAIDEGFDSKYAKEVAIGNIERLLKKLKKED